MKKYFLLLSLLVVFQVKAQIDITNLTGGTLTSQYADSPDGETGDKLIDNQSTTKYLTFNSQSWIQYKSPASYIISKYTITSGNDAPERDPKNWELTGSNNGVTFYPIDSRTNQVFSSRGLKKEFLIVNNGKAYLYYRLRMTNNSGTILQLSEIEIFGSEGSLPTEPFADFSVNSYLITQLPVSFSNASLNTTSCSWTFEGGTPATSTDPNPKVKYTNPGNFTVKLVASNGTSSVTKTMNITIKDVNDWSSFVYPTINLTCVNTSNPGYIKYTNLAKMKGFNTIQDFVKNCCLVIAKELYYTVDEANEHNLRTINYKLNEGGALSYKGGSIPAIEIGFDMNYLNTFSQSHSDAVSADEIYGILCHELCHGYQREPRNAGVYAGGTEYFGFIEGTADLARLLTGGFNPKRYPRVGGSITDGYNTTAFFYQWLTNKYSSTFLKDLNRTALTINPWTFDAATQALLGESAQSLWSKYQLAIPTLDVASPKEGRVTISVNSSKSELSIINLNVNESVSIYNINGKQFSKSVSTSSIHTVDIKRLPKGVYVVNIGDDQSGKSIKFVK